MLQKLIPQNDYDQYIISNKMELIELIPKTQQNAIQQMIDRYEAGKEFEVSLFSSKETSQDLLTFEKFENLTSVLTAVAEREKVIPKYANSLDITLSLKNIKEQPDLLTTYRITITEMEQINQYMEMLHQRKNSLVFSVLVGFIYDKNAENKNITIMKKVKHVREYITLEDVYLRFKLDDELSLTRAEVAKLSDIVKNFKETEYGIAYRLKERASYKFTREGNEFSVDLTRVRTSNRINAIENNNIKREVEIEANIKNKKTVLPSILKLCGFVIKTVQSSNYIVTKSVADAVVANYRSVLNVPTDRNQLWSRKVISLEVQHVVDFLPAKYSITDKADGLHTQLIVMETGKCFILSQNLVITDVGIIVDKKFANSILDGELIFIPKYQKYLFMCFDVLVIGQNNVKNEESLFRRLEAGDELIQAINKTKYTYSPIDLEKYNVSEFTGKTGMLEYHKQNILAFFDDIDATLKGKSHTVIARRKYFIPVYGVKNNEVFKYISMMWNLYSHDSNLKCPYHLDGWVAQPMNEKYVVEKNLVKLFDYKWKPPTQNSIDFYAEFEKEQGTNKMLICFDNTNQNAIKNRTYCIINLFVGSTANGVEKPMPFMPEKGLSQMFVYLDENDLPRSLDGKVIVDKSVIECIWSDADVPTQFKWVCIRQRADKSELVAKHGVGYGNFITTATNIYQSIMNPLLENDFDILADDVLMPEYFEKLRGRINMTIGGEMEGYFKEKNNINTSMRKFNNYIKSNIIYTYANVYYRMIQQTIFDMACGRGAEIQKEFYVEPRFVLNCDIDEMGLTEIRSRYENMRKTKARVPPMSFIKLDLGTRVDVESQERTLGAMTHNNKELINKFFGDPPTKFTFAMCNFALHYFFKNEMVWNNFLNTLDNSTHESSIFIATLFDGDMVRKKLEGIDHYDGFYTDTTGDKKLLFDIVKKYDEKSTDEYGQCISVHMSWISEDGVYLDEYLVKPAFLIAELDRIGFDLIETDTFQNQYENSRRMVSYASKHDGSKNKNMFNDLVPFYSNDQIDEVSRNYSFLNRYYVFRKRERNLLEVYDKYYKNEIGKFAKFAKNNKK